MEISGDADVTWELIKSGSFGSVFKVTRHSTGQVYAVKRIPNEFMNEQTRQEFSILSDVCRVPEIARRVVCTVDAPPGHRGLVGGQYWELWFPWYGGRDLEDFIAESRDHLTSPADHFARVRSVAIQLARTIELLHSENVVHRDIKPANLLVVEELPRWLSIRLLDFGLACHSCNDVMGQGVGSPLYMPPSMWRKLAPWNMSISEEDDDDTDPESGDALSGMSETTEVPAVFTLDDLKAHDWFSLGYTLAQLFYMNNELEKMDGPWFRLRMQALEDPYDPSVQEHMELFEQSVSPDGDGSELGVRLAEFIADLVTERLRTDEAVMAALREIPSR